MEPDNEQNGAGLDNAEQEFREAQHLLETIFDHTHLMLAYLDPEFNFIRVNRTYALADGQEPSYFPGKNHFDLYPNAENEAIFRRVAQTGEPHMAFAKPFRYMRHPERGISYWDWSLVPVRDENGAVSSLILSLLNVTEHKQTGELIKHVLESIDEGLFVIDTEYRIITANRAYLDMVGLPAERVIGIPCYEISGLGGRPCYELGVDCAVKHTFETGEPYAALHVLKKGGVPLNMETKSYPMRNAEGNVVSAIEIINNVTERCKLEEQLRQAQKMEAIGRLAAGISHDFNNILTAIIGYASITQKKMRHDDPLKINLDQILASADRASYLTQSLLAFSRKQINNPVIVDLNWIIGKVEKFLVRIIGEDIEFRTRLTDRALPVMADTSQIENVLMNLATNARDAMPGGGVFSISTDLVMLDRGFVRTHGYGEEGHYALMTVTDTGTGIDKKIVDRIFEPFFTTKEVGKGTGLGLSIIYGIIKQHKGYISCYSEPGKGTTFKVYLPAIKTDNVAETDTEETRTIRGGTETVLVAEDEEIVRTLVRHVLEEMGYRVIEAAGGEEALEKFMMNRDEVGLLLFDFIMPGMNGLEAYEKIKQTRPDIKVLFTSGYPEEYIYKRKILSQGLEFISKPASPAELLRKVREILDKE